MSWQAWDFGASGLTLIDGANIITGTILANSIKSKSIGANQIAAGAIDTSLLTFTPVTSGTGGATDLAKQVVAAINSDQEGGLKIVANKLTLTGLLQVGGAAADINSGATLISGGKIQTDSIDAAAIKAGAITTDKLTVGTVQRQNLLANGHFGTYNTFGNSAAGWTLDPAVSFVSQYGTYTPAGSTVALKVPSLQVNPGGGKVLAQQVVTVIPGRQYTLVGMLYHDAGTAGIRVFTAKGSGDYELSSNTNAGTPAGSIVPAFYQNATYISNGASASSVAARWNLYGYRVTIPTDVTQVAIQICGWNTATTNHYPGFIQFYDDNLTEATASLDMVNQLQNVAFGGDVTGNYAATVNRICNRNVSTAAPNNGSVFTWNSTSSWWEPNTIAGILGYTPANKAGDTFTGAVALNTGAFPSASTGGSIVTLVGGLGSPWAGKTYFGDGTGWKYAFSRRSASVDTDVLTIQDNGNITALGSISATAGTFSSNITTGGRLISTGQTSPNLHLDPTAGANSVYLSFYQGTGGTKFGNGAGGVVASIDGSGNGNFNGSLSAATGAFSGGALSVSGGTPTLQILDQVGQNPRIVFMGQTNAWFWIDSPPGGFLRISNGNVPGSGAVSFYTDGSVSMGSLTATTGTFSGALSATTGNFTLGTFTGSSGQYALTVLTKSSVMFRVRNRSDFGLSDGVAFDIRDNTDSNSLPLQIRSSLVDFLMAPVSMGALTAYGTSNLQNSTQYSGPTLGSNRGTLFISTGDNGNYNKYGLMFGVSGCGDTWIQSQRVDGGLAAYNLQIQPAGGSTVFGNGIGSVSMGALSATTGTFSGNVYITNTNTTLSQGAGGALRVTTPSGYLDLGAQNSYFAHLSTDRPSFYFNQSIQVNGDIYRYGTSTGINGSGFNLQAGNGYALRFWNGADAYSIGMNDYTSTSFGNNGYNTGGADYNMCFRMDGNDAKRGGSDSVARGFLFRNNSLGSNTFAQLAPFGNYTYWGGMLMLRDSGNNNMYGLFVLNGVLYLKQMA
jgi:hypothetical protein